MMRTSWLGFKMEASRHPSNKVAEGEPGVVLCICHAGVACDTR